MLLAQSVEEERSFVLAMVVEAGKKGESVGLTTVTDSFVKKHDYARRPGLFDAIRQLKEEGLIVLQTPGNEVIINLP